MNEEIIGIEVSGEIYPIKDEATNTKIQTLETKVQGLESSISSLEGEIEKVKTGDIYSTDEIKCGTWIDGKPIYRKVIESTPDQAGECRIDSSSLNIEQLTVFRGMFDDTEHNYAFPVPDYSDGDTHFYLAYNKQSSKMYYKGGNVYGIRGKLTILIEYTKTTD